MYDQIVQSHADGVWLRTIHQKTGLHDHTITTAIKRLEAKHLIKSLRSVEAKNKRMYIKATVAPSERATGGVWFTDQDLDVAFIDLLYKVVLKYVTDESTYRSSSSSGSGSGAADGRTKAPRKGVVRGGVGSGASGDAGGPSTDAAGGGGNRKRKATDLDSATATSARQHSTSSTQHHRSQAGYTLLPLPAGYTGYPTVRQIAQFIARTGITTNTTLSVADVQQLVDVLVWDGKLEKVRIKPAPAPQTAAPHSSVPLAAGGGRRGAMPATPTGQSTASTAASAVEQFGYRAVLAAVAPRGVVGGPGKAVPLVSAVAGVPAAADSEQQQDQAWARSNGLTEVPCGRCPVFDECEVGGPVSPIGCVYFAEWLGLRRAAKSDLEVF